MGRWFSTCFLLGVAAISCLSSSASASDPDIVPFSKKFPVSISVLDRSEVHRIQKLNIDVDAVGEGWIRAYVDRSEIEALEAMGYEVERIPNQALRMWHSIRDLELLGVKDAYHDYDALTTYLQGVAADHSAITELVSVGRSVDGRELWFMKITDNPGVEEDEPEFKYISTMHGDEPVGTENCLKFIDLLTDNYDSGAPDEGLKRLVDEVEIWIMPMMNPDGNSAGSRYNAHGVDLNRSFPDWIQDPNNTPAGREPEIQAVMEFSDSMSFDLSANFHTGALLVNYTWDNRAARTPDDNLFISMSEAYSIHNGPMWNSSSFYHGISNGYDWYEIHGSMQDWNYDWMHDKEVTIELNDIKWPDASELPRLWDDNDEAMPAYLEYCLRGIRGIVNDSASGEPLLATVHVEGNAWDDVTDPDVGDFHRILDPGVYTLTFSRPGYMTKQVPGVIVASDSATVLDIGLAMAPLVTVSGSVTSEELVPLQAKVEFCYHAGGGLADSTTADPGDGSYSLTLPAAEYDIEVTADGYVPEQLLAEVASDTTFDFELRSASGAVLVISDGSGEGTELAEDLMLMGVEVMEETAAATAAETWPAYELIVWSSGRNTSPVSSSSYRRSLIDYVAQEGRLLIEGGEVAYDAVSSPGYPDFADSVLHTDDWNGDDVGSLSRNAGQASHPIATEPNALPAAIAVDYAGWGSQDAAHPSGGAYIVYGTASHPTDAGILVYEGAAGPDHGQIVYLAFAYADLSDRAVARQLLENVVTYINDDDASVEGTEATGRRPALIVASPNPFSLRTDIGFSIPTRQRVDLAIYDVRGRLVKTLITGTKDGGLHHAAWYGDDGRARQMSPGVYFCRFTTRDLTRTRKIVKIR